VTSRPRASASPSVLPVRRSSAVEKTLATYMNIPLNDSKQAAWASPGRAPIEPDAVTVRCQW
jgi:hypothetical protein